MFWRAQSTAFRFSAPVVPSQDRESTVRRRTLGSVFKRKGIWYVRFWHRGKEYRESSRSTVRDVAVALLQKRHSEIVTGTLLGPDAQRTTFDDLVRLIEQDYALNGRKRTREMLGRVARLRESFGNVLPVDLTHATLTNYVERRQREGAKPASIRYELAVLGRMFTLAIRSGRLSTKPLLPSLKVVNARKGFFEPEEIGRVLQHLPDDFAPAIAFAYVTGWRKGRQRTTRVGPSPSPHTPRWVG